MVLDLDLSTGKGVTIVAFAAIVGTLWLVTGGFTLLLGAAIVGLVLLVAYYVGVRIHRWAAGKRGGRV